MMSSVYPTRVPRQPLRVWRWPRQEHLLEQVFRRGPPPFDPFPSIQDIVDAVLCPVTVVHRTYHGLHGALSGPRGIARGEGDHFHRFVSILKSNIALGKRRLDEAFSLLRMYCSMEGLDADSESNLRRYLSYWLRRKRDSLDELWGQGPRIFHEVHVSTINATFREKRDVRYPVHGVIDEIDTINKRIVERTLKGNENDSNPPFLEDFQVWLQWKVLTSINRDLFPDILRNENFQDYDLIVETPYRDFTIEKNQSLFEEWAEDALAWISDIARSSVAISDAWQNKGHHTRSCSIGNEIEECYFARVACYHRRWRYPERRSTLHASLGPIYKALYNEQVWVHDLLLYQLTKMEQDADLNFKSELRRLLTGRNIYPLEIEENIEDNRYRVKIDETVRMSLVEEVQDENLSFDLLFGSFSVGLRRRAYLLLDEIETNPEDGRYVVYIEGMDGTERMNAFLLRGLLLKEDPWFLKRLVQQAVFSLEKWGVDREDRANNHVAVRLIDTLFGPGTLRARRKKNEFQQ
jgi:hypothetical protein